MPESSDPTTVPTAQVEVLLPAHLHARPAGALVRTAARFSSTVEISYQDRTANARSVLAVMGLGALAGSAVLVRAWGDDATEAVREIAQVLAAAQ